MFDRTDHFLKCQAGEVMRNLDYKWGCKSRDSQPVSLLPHAVLPEVAETKLSSSMFYFDELCEKYLDFGFWHSVENYGKFAVDSSFSCTPSKYLQLARPS